MKNFYFGLEHKIIIALITLSYFVSMGIQARDPQASTKFLDWLFAFITSFVGGAIVYLIVYKTFNVGMRIGISVWASLISYRTFKFVISDENQRKTSESLGGYLRRILKKFINEKND